jgi:hypothetical protein
VQDRAMHRPEWDWGHLASMQRMCSAIYFSLTEPTCSEPPVYVYIYIYMHVGGACSGFIAHGVSLSTLHRQHTSPYGCRVDWDSNQPCLLAHLVHDLPSQSASGWTSALTEARRCSLHACVLHCSCKSHIYIDVCVYAYRYIYIYIYSGTWRIELRVVYRHLDFMGASRV